LFFGAPYFVFWFEQKLVFARSLELRMKNQAQVCFVFGSAEILCVCTNQQLRISTMQMIWIEHPAMSGLFLRAKNAKISGFRRPNFLCSARLCFELHLCPPPHLLLQFTTGPELTALAGYIVNVNQTHGGDDDDEKEALMSPKAATAAAPAPANGTAAAAKPTGAGAASSTAAAAAPAAGAAKPADASAAAAAAAAAPAAAAVSVSGTLVRWVQL
jgi:hypothetical protein